ncbi:MAG: hypothetical protein KA419_18020 [Acidobacteria bacterium]|nr:hypothetical protein [Acidobacteriota bacterium]
MQTRRDRWLNGKSTRMGRKWALFGLMALLAAGVAGWLALYLQVSRGVKVRVEADPARRDALRLTVVNRGPLPVTVRRFHLVFVEAGVARGDFTFTPAGPGLDLARGGTASLTAPFPASIPWGRQASALTSPGGIDVLGTASYATVLTRGDVSFSGSLPR